MPRPALFRVHGLIVRSAIGLGTVRAPGRQVQAHIRTGAVRPCASTSRRLPGSGVIQGDRTALTLDYAQVGRFRVMRGRSITVQPASRAPPALVRTFLAGPAMAALLHQRGRLVLHASAILLGGRAVAFAGRSGSGKSTVAALLAGHGHPLVTDDVLALRIANARAVTWPGIPELKLWPASLRLLGEDARCLPRVHRRIEKRVRSAAGPAGDGPLPLAAVYLLHEGASLGTLPLAPHDAVLELIRHSYCAQLLRFGGAARHLRQCAALARHIPIRRLTLPHHPDALSSITTVITLLERDLPSGTGVGAAPTTGS